MSKKPKQAKSTNTVKRAAIYVRVSSERQAKGTLKERSLNPEEAKKHSPKAQEQDCRELCERQGYIVTEVYRDTEKYRVGGRLVEPSGTRSDRPQFKRMLADADAGAFDVIIAWREDRMYRGANRACMEISERVEHKVIEVELAKDHYDPNTATVKAWAAGQELKAKSDRFFMGVAGRLEKGKVWGPNAPYGYDYDPDSGRWVLNETEALWVRRVWQWFGAGVTAHEIRRRLIAAGVPQKGTAPRKHTWSLSCIRKIFTRDDYYTGKVITHFDGETYETTVPAIIDQATYQAVKDRLAHYKAYPAGNYKQYALAAGQIFCKACNQRMGVVSNVYHYYYRCNSLSHAVSGPGCAHNVSMGNIDAAIWAKVWDLASTPGKLEAAIQERIAVLQAESADAQADCDKLQAQLDEIALKRQQVIAWALARIISQDDLQMQLAGLDWQAASLQHDISQAALLTGDRASKLIAIAQNFRQEIGVGRELLALTDRTPEQEQAVFDFKRKIIQGVVTRIDVLPDKSTQVSFEISLEQEGSGAELLISDMSSR